MGWNCRTGASLSTTQKSRQETKRGRERRQDTKAQKQTRRAQAAGGRAGDDPGSTPRPTHTHRTAPHRPINTTTHARGRDRQSRHAKLRSRRGGERRRDRNPRARTVQAAILTGGVAPAWCSPSGPSFQLGILCEEERAETKRRQTHARTNTHTDADAESRLHASGSYHNALSSTCASTQTGSQLLMQHMLEASTWMSRLRS